MGKIVGMGAKPKKGENEEVKKLKEENKRLKAEIKELKEKTSE